MTTPIIPFYSYTNPYSNHYIRWMNVDGVRFNCVEQYMMYKKAEMFDPMMCDQILECSIPARQKKLGRLVKNYDDAKWSATRYDIVKHGVHAKFAQHRDIKQLLLDTRQAILVEASPSDDIWGVKLGVDHPDIKDPTKWRGQNLLGKILMEVRDELRNEQW